MGIPTPVVLPLVAKQLVRVPAFLQLDEKALLPQRLLQFDFDPARTYLPVAHVSLRRARICPVETHSQLLLVSRAHQLIMPPQLLHCLFDQKHCSEAPHFFGKFPGFRRGTGTTPATRAWCTEAVRND